MASKTPYRMALGLAIAASLFMAWANLAVGFVGNEEHPVNTLYFAIPAVGLVAAIVARFKAAGMVWALTAMAVAQVIVAIIAQVQGHFTWVLTAVFVVLWLIAAALFRTAAKGDLLAQS